MRDVLLATLAEREPDLTAHVHDVAALATAVGRRLELSPVELDEVARAAELHDIGKIAIPDSILGKPGPLTEQEWAFMRRHTVIGERILLAAPTMAGVARLVRSHHELQRHAGTQFDPSVIAALLAVIDDQARSSRETLAAAGQDLP
jgi:HD-GYP domain-containing protein (c-di-GMP phosphodiesterase class II)